LNLVVIPIWQHVGAALATVISELVIGLAFIALLPKWLLPRSSLLVAAKAALAAGVMSLSILLAANAPLPIVILLGGIVYVVLVVAMRAVPNEDLAVLRQAMRRRRDVGATA
jgi:peptidoglycan biosynthesis protein MviN/MurJ (putative lipid II flippase)